MISFLGMLIGGGIAIWWVFYRDNEEKKSDN